MFRENPHWKQGTRRDSSIPSPPPAPPTAPRLARRERSLLEDVLIYTMVTVMVIGLLFVLNSGVQYLITTFQEIFGSAQ